VVVKKPVPGIESPGVEVNPIPVVPGIKPQPVPEIETPGLEVNPIPNSRT
jgi:hypothetical protein